MERIYESGVIISQRYLTKCEICEISGHQTKDSFHLRTANAAVVSTKCGADSGKGRHNSKNSKKARVTIED